jgi:hypothetical protein
MDKIIFTIEGKITVSCKDTDLSGVQDVIESIQELGEVQISNVEFKKDSK